MNIDIHSHYVVEECFQKFSEHKDVQEVIQKFSGPESAEQNIDFFESIRDKLSNPRTRIQDMDRTGVDIQILSPPPYLFYYWADKKTGVSLSRLQNDKISEICRQYPNRFIGMGTVPLQNVREANTELERISKRLNLKGVIISSNINGKDLDLPTYFPFFEKAALLNLLVYVHPWDTKASKRIQKYYLTNLVGNPLETTIAASRLIFSGLFRKLPDLKVCFAHGGGSLPYIIGRINRGYVVRTECRKEISRPPLEYFKRLYFDTVTHHPLALEYLVRVAGSDHVLLGTDYPYDMGEEDPVGLVTHLPISERDQKKILGENLRRVFGI